LRCPANIYRQLSDEGVRYAPEIDAYVVSRHDDVVRVDHPALRGATK
jgi:hypothetical protein